MRRTLIGTVMALLAVGPAVVAAEPKAEIRTWTGQSWRLSEITLDVFYTVPPKAEEPGAAAPSPPPEATSIAGGTGQQRFTTTRVSGSAEDLGTLFGREAGAISGQRSATTITLSKGDVETRIPIERIASVLFARQPVWTSMLPPYVAPGHFRYSATVVLTDGSRLEADYVNLGTMRLRGTGPHGRIDLSWQDVEVVRFER